MCAKTVITFGSDSKLTKEDKLKNADCAIWSEGGAFLFGIFLRNFNQ